MSGKTSGGKSSGSKAASSPKSGSGARGLTVKVKTAKRRSTSSTRWLQRQLNDPYVQEARRQGLRSRAAFKLRELNERFHLLKPGMRVVDLGAAPGGWTQVCVQAVGAKGKVVAIDILDYAPIAGAVTLQGDFLAEDTPERLYEALEGAHADAVLSDMAPPTTGHPSTDHLRIMGLVEVALDFATSVLADGGIFVAKVFQGGAEKTLLDQLKRDFATVRHAKPPASRKESSETYVIATGYRGQRD